MRIDQKVYEAMSDQAVLLPKWLTHGGITLAKGQLGHFYTFWTMPILIFSPVPNFGQQSIVLTWNILFLMPTGKLHPNRNYGKQLHGHNHQRLYDYSNVDRILPNPSFRHCAGGFAWVALGYSKVLNKRRTLITM